MSKVKNEREINRQIIRNLFLAICVFIILMCFLVAPYFIIIYSFGPTIQEPEASIGKFNELLFGVFIIIFGAGVLFDRFLLKRWWK